MSDFETAVRSAASDFRVVAKVIVFLLLMFGPLISAVVLTGVLFSLQAEPVILIPICIVWIIAIFVTDVVFTYLED